jgi:hypothetical protein
MLKSFFATGALLAAVTSVAHVKLGADGAVVGDKTVNQPFLQLREAEGGNVLVSKDSVESLGSLIEVSVDGGVVSIEPGIRLSRTAEGYELSTHARRSMVLMTSKGTLTVPSPALIVASEGGWKIGKAESLDGETLRVALSSTIDATRVALADGTGTGTPPVTGGGGNSRLDIRRVVYIDPLPGAEPTDEQTVKRTKDVSPAGF